MTHTKDPTSAPDAAGLLRAAEAAAGAVPPATEACPAEGLAEEPLVSAESEGLAMALTAITWEQTIALEPWPEPQPITPELYLGQSPLIGAAHEDDYTLIGGAP